MPESIPADQNPFELSGTPYGWLKLKDAQTPASRIRPAHTRLSHKLTIRAGPDHARLTMQANQAKRDLLDTTRRSAVNLLLERPRATGGRLRAEIEKITSGRELRPEGPRIQDVPLSERLVDGLQPPSGEHGVPQVAMRTKLFPRERVTDLLADPEFPL